MFKAGVGILVGSIVVSILLLVLWFVGLLVYVGGSLIHLLLVLGLMVGVGGSLIGFVVMLVGKARSHSK